MSDTTDISWCDRTWSPWEGCTKVSPACDHCYAERRNKWLARGANWGPGAPRRLTSDWTKPLLWNRHAAKAGKRISVFPSICDPFDNEVDPAWRVRFFELIDSTPHLTWLLLTKRIGNAARTIADTLDDAMLARSRWPWPNVWLGATVVTQEEADRDIPKLLAVPARVRFVSIEPMLEPVNLAESMLDWVICGGESGPGARPMLREWARSLRDQCAAAGVPFHFKQWGEHAPNWFTDERGAEIQGSAWVDRMGKKMAGRLLDGVEHNGFPT